MFAGRSEATHGPRLAAMLLLAASATPATHADTHVYAGAAGLVPGVSPLAWVGAGSFEVGSGYSFPMVLRTTGLNAGFFRGDLLTFTALAATDLGTGQLEGRALLGTRIAVQVRSVEGPPGGELQFWEGDGENPGSDITFRVPVGTTDAEHALVISENEGAPGADPYGHIHGRAFTFSQPGRYVVGFRLIDVATNGPAGGPLHTPSSVLAIAFQAGHAIDTLTLTPTAARVQFRSAPGVSNVLEAADSPLSTNWSTVAGPLRGNTAVQSLTEPNPPPGPRFYRLRLLNVPP